MQTDKEPISARTARFYAIPWTPRTFLSITLKLFRRKLIDGVKINIEFADPNVWSVRSNKNNYELIKCSHDFIDKESLFGIFDLIAKNAFLALSVRLAAAWVNLPLQWTLKPK